MRDVHVNMKLWVPNQVVFHILLVGILLHYFENFDVEHSNDKHFIQFYSYTAPIVVHSEVVYLPKMEKVNFGYSIKNIPIPNERSYLLQLMEKLKRLLKEWDGKL